MVRMEGVEPSQPNGHRILSPACLPVPPHSQTEEPSKVLSFEKILKKKSRHFVVKMRDKKIKNGAGNRIRIGDLLHGKQMLYQLSYSRTEAKDITVSDNRCQIRFSDRLQRLAVEWGICYRNGAATHDNTR